MTLNLRMTITAGCAVALVSTNKKEKKKK